MNVQATVGLSFRARAPTEPAGRPVGYPPHVPGAGKGA
jgi:hypothetical protein